MTTEPSRAPRSDAGSPAAMLIDGMQRKNAFFPRRIGDTMRVETHRGRLVIDSGLRSDTFNVVIDDAPAQASEPADEAAVAEIARGFTRRGLPAAWWTLDGATPAARVATLAEHGFVADEHGVGMLRAFDQAGGASALPAVAYPAGFTLRQAVRADDVARFAALVGALFVPPDRCVNLFYQRVAALGLDADVPLRLYLGELDGIEVCTVAACVVDGVAHLFDVSTRADLRRRGLAQAMLHAVLSHERARSCIERAALQAAPDALGVYRRLGFVDVCGFTVYSNRAAVPG